MDDRVEDLIVGYVAGLVTGAFVIYLLKKSNVRLVDVVAEYTLKTVRFSTLSEVLNNIVKRLSPYAV